MKPKHDWRLIAPQIIYAAYPDQDLLPIEPPKPGESISDFEVRARDAADTLFLFLCREAEDEIDAEEYSRRLDRAIGDIQAVRAAFEDHLDTHTLDPNGGKCS